MFRFLTPIFLIIIAVTIFVTYTRPTFEATKVLQAEINNYDQAIEHANQLKARIDELIAESNSFSEDDMERLRAMLPEDLDEVEVIMSLDTLAARHNLTFGTITVTALEASAEESLLSEEERRATNYIPETDPTMTAVATEVEPQVPEWRPVQIGFALEGDYDDFRGFLDDIEASLLLTDTALLSIADSGESSTGSNFAMTVQVYEFTPKSQ